MTSADPQKRSADSFSREASRQRPGFLSEYVYLLKKTGKWWLLPMLVIMLALGAMMVLLAFTGTSLSKHVIARMNDKSFRFWTRWTVMTLGLFYLGQGVWMLVK